MNWLDYWRQHALPVLQSSKEALLVLHKRHESARLTDIEAIVLDDPMLCAQVLRMASQRRKTTLSSELVAVEHIVMMIGVAPFLERCLKLPSIEQYMLPAYAPNYAKVQQLIGRARLRKQLILDFGRARNDAYPEEIATAALISLIPDLVQLIGQSLPEPPPDWAGETYGQLLDHWQIPAVLRDLQGQSPVPSIRAAMQMATNQLTTLLERGWWQDGIGQQLEIIAAAANQLPEQIWLRTVQQLLLLARRKSVPAAFADPAVLLPMLPGDWPQPAAPRNTTAPVHDVLSERMQALHLAGKQGAPTNQIMTLAMRALVEGLALRRIAFALVQPAEQVLRTRYAHGIEPADALRNMVIHLDQPSLFSQLLQKPQSVWLNAQTRSRFASHLPAEFLAASSCDSLLMSIFVGNKPLGLIYADLHGSSPLGEHHYSHFKQICMLTSRALTTYSQRPS